MTQPKILAALAMLGISACTITQQVRPVKNISGGEVCIVENPPVRAGFLKEFRRTLEANGYKVKMLPANAGLNDCPVTSTYLARWSWDIAIYMSYAEIKVYQDGRPVGDALYDARGGGGRVFDKFVRGESKVRELVNQLFPGR